MSGINTLIDTLMHSVLGKRVDIPLQKELNAPVRPISPSDAPLAVRAKRQKTIPYTTNGKWRVSYSARRRNSD